MEHEGEIPVVSAGSYPPELLEVCRLWNVAPGALLGWSVRKDGVTILLPSGAKVGVSICGSWGEEEFNHRGTESAGGREEINREGAKAAQEVLGAKEERREELFLKSAEEEGAAAPGEGRGQAAHPTRARRKER